MPTIVDGTNLDMQTSSNIGYMSACTGWGGGMLRRTPEVLARLATQASTLASLQPWSTRRCSNQSLWTNQR